MTQELETLADARCAHSSAKPWLDMPLDVKSGKDTSFGHLLWCDECNRGVVADLPDGEQIKAHYDLERYYTQGGGHMPLVTPGLLDRLVGKLAWSFDQGSGRLAGDVAQRLPAGGDVLDIGCGDAGLLAEMAPHGFKGTGIEPDPKAREVAASVGFQAYPGTAEVFPQELSGETFDLVVMKHVLEHCVVPEDALSNARAALRPDGVLYCEVPNCGSHYFRQNAQISEMLDVPRHLHFFTKKALEKICADVGLNPVDWRYHGYTRHFNASWCAWENAIHDQLVARNAQNGSARRSHLGSVGLIAKSAFAPADQKYDCIGFFAKAM